MPGIRAIAAAAVTVLTIAPAPAQDWPARPVTMVVPFAPGSGSDILGRIIAPRIADNLGAPLVIENVGGAGGMVGAARVMKAPADGYQLLLATAGTHAVNQTLYSHLACVLLNAAIGIEVTHVPYRSTAQALQDLLPGRLDYQCVPIAAAVPQVESKTLKAIAVMARTRSPILPALPTAHEQGLADFEVDTWYAIFLPKGAPPGIIEKLNASAIAAMNSADVRARLEVVAPERRSPDYLASFVVREIAKWAGPIRAAGISMD